MKKPDECKAVSTALLPVLRLITRAAQRGVLPQLIKLILGVLHIAEILMRVRVLNDRVVDAALPGELVERLHRRLHPLNSQKSCEVRGEGCQHQNDEKPVRSHDDSTTESFRRFASTFERGI